MLDKISLKLAHQGQIVQSFVRSIKLLVKIDSASSLPIFFFFFRKHENSSAHLIEKKKKRQCFSMYDIRLSCLLPTFIAFLIQQVILSHFMKKLTRPEQTYVCFLHITPS